MTKLTGTAYRPFPNQPPPILFKRQQPEPIIQNPDWAKDGLVDASPASPIVRAVNLNRVRCPLCRRINTVTLATAAADKKSANTFRCSYDGCRGYEWSE